jgi:aspartate/methionine/tyrosine aminotransferase
MNWTGRTSALVRPPIAKVNRVAAELSAQGRDLIDLGQAILGLAPPAAALQAARDWMTTAKPHGYSPDPGLPALRDAIAAYLRDRKAVPCPSGEHVMVTCGANQAFANVLLAVTQPGDEVITFGPGYFDHDYTIAMAGCCKVEAPLALREGRFVFDLDEVERALTPRSRCVVLVSPGNPTGAVAPEAFVRALCELCEARGLWLISDETYDLITYAPARHVSPASVSRSERIAVLGSFSKCFAMAAWRVGYLAGSARLLEETFKVQDALVICAPVPSQMAVLGALSSLDAYVDSARQELLARRAALLQGLRGWKDGVLLPGEGATFMLAKLHGRADDVAYCEQMVHRAGVVAVPGSAFGSHGAGMVRFSFGNQPSARITEAAARLLA